MAISVAPGAADLPADLSGRFLVLIRGADDTGAALAGLSAARDTLAALGAAGGGTAPVLSEVVLSPDGPLLRVGSLDADEEVMQTIPDVVAEALERSGVAAGHLEFLEPGGALDQLDRTPSAVVLRCFPHPGRADGRVPLSWLEVAADWVLGDATADETVSLRLLGAPFLVPAREAAATLHAALTARAWCDLVHGRLDDRIRTASLTFGRAPHLALAAGGPGCNTTALLARFELLREVARDVPDVAYACVDLEDTFASVGAGLSGTGWPERGGADPHDVVSRAADLVLPDAYPVQLLGPGHLARLRGHANEQLEHDAELLDDGRLEVALGDPMDWLPRFETRVDAVELATKALADLLVTEAELAALVADRPTVTPIDAGAAGGSASGGPDLDDITLEAVPHPRRGLRLTLLELASWLAHEAHSDAPRTVSPVIAAYARWLASGLGTADRQALKPYAARLAGSRAVGLAPGPWRPLPPVEGFRADRAVDWLARDQAAAWLRTAAADDGAAGLARHAAALTKVRRLADGSHRARQLRLLDAALVELQVHAAEAGGRADGEVAWDTWERAGELCGWVAASEAAWIGVPDAVASAAELRALEVARTSGTAGGEPASVAIRAAALAAAAADGWRRAGEAAAVAVDDHLADHDGTSPTQMAAVPLPTAWERAVRGAANRLGMDRDAAEAAVEDAEASARGVLADLIDGGTPPDGTLEIARRAAEASRGGEVWRTVRELAAGVVGDDAWAHSQAAAAEALDRVLHHAPPVVDRAVVVALAREVAGLAARTAVAHGGAVALEGTVHELAPSAVGLLDAMLAIR